MNNELTIERFIAGEGLMVGDITEYRNLIGLKKTGRVSFLESRQPTRLDYSARYRTKRVRVAFPNGIRKVRPSTLTLLQRNRTYRQLNIEKFETEDWKSTLPDRCTEDPLKPLINALSADGLIEQSLKLGVKSLVLNNDEETAIILFRKTRDQAAFSLREFDDGTKNHWQYPPAHANILICDSISEALLSQSLNASTLIEAAEHLEQYCKETSSGYWDSMGKCHYLVAIMATLHANETDKARELLKSRRSFTRFKDLRAVLMSFARSGTSGLNREKAQFARDCFDLYRHPYIHLNNDVFGQWMIATLLGGLIEKYIETPDRSVDWHAVIRAVYR